MKMVFRFFAALLALNVLVSYASPARADELGESFGQVFVDDLMAVQGGSLRVPAHGKVDQLASAVITAWIERLQEKWSVAALDGKSGQRDPYAPKYGVSISDDEFKVKVALKF